MLRPLFSKNLILFFFLLCTFTHLFAQPAQYTIANTHAHNDYDHPVPFYTAYYAGFGSIEADVILQNNQLYVAHDSADVKTHRTLQSLYLDPLAAVIKTNGGNVYKDAGKTLLLLIDLKSAAVPSLNALTSILEGYPALTSCATLRIVITGNQPPISSFTSYPAYLFFDGNLKNTYNTAVLQRIGLYSDNFKNYTKWNGKGIPVAADRKKITDAVEAVHALKKPMRFWAAPDLPNAWYQLMHYKVDYINTDKIPEIAAFLNKLPANSYTSTVQQPVYKPAFTGRDNTKVPVKNVILLIGDGMGLAHIYAAYTANRGQLNILQMRNMGMSKTDAADTYITDSGGGGTAMATGQKTNNRFIGVDKNGADLAQLPALLKARKKATGIITTGDVTDATPASFYAHYPERDSSVQIARYFVNAPVDVMMGGGAKHFSHNNDSLIKALRSKGVTVTMEVNNTVPITNRTLVLDDKALLTSLAGRGNFLETAMQRSLLRLGQNSNGFFLMAEGAKIDAGGHYNNMGMVVTELLDFDKAVGQALRYADTHPGTLVIVTADHETGGLTLLDGDLQKGYVSGHFSTEDHTAISVPVFAYGPHSGLFTGFYNNTQIFEKILQLTR